jgi:hypothetical protein
MSNELTPQQKYPKFYESPHLWIGGPIQLQCIEKHLELKGDPRSEVSLGSQFLFDAEMYNSIWLFGTIDKYLPLFKPQEGEQFLKDLEKAVQYACSGNYKVTTQSYWLQFYEAGSRIFIMLDNPSLVVTNTNFDTAAYVDTLRKLGYYL